MAVGRSVGSVIRASAAERRKQDFGLEARAVGGN